MLTLVLATCTKLGSQKTTYLLLHLSLDTFLKKPKTILLTTLKEFKVWTKHMFGKIEETKNERREIRWERMWKASASEKKMHEKYRNKVTAMITRDSRVLNNTHLINIILLVRYSENWLFGYHQLLTIWIPDSSYIQIPNVL